MWCFTTHTHRTKFLAWVILPQSRLSLNYSSLLNRLKLVALHVRSQEPNQQGSNRG